MTVNRWQVNWNGYQMVFDAQGGLPASGTSRISLQVSTGAGAGVVAEGWFKLRRQGFWDVDLSRDFDQIVISNIEIDQKHRGIGLGTEIVRAIAGHFPEALIVGENPNEDANAWHAERLDSIFPSRMMRVQQGVEVRVSPGIEIDQNEL